MQPLSILRGDETAVGLFARSTNKRHYVGNAVIVIQILFTISLIPAQTALVQLNLAMLAVIGIGYGLDFMQCSRAACTVLLTAMWGYITISSLLCGGLDNPILLMYFLLVILAADFHDRRIVIAMLILSMGSSIGIYWAEVEKLSAGVAFAIPEIYFVLTILLNLITVAVFYYSTTGFGLDHVGGGQLREVFLADLHHVMNQLSRVETLDDVYRQAIELGRSKFHFERIGLFRYDPENDLMTGTFGTNFEGKIWDKRHFTQSLSAHPRIRQAMENQERLIFSADTDLFDEGHWVGRGWRATATLWDGNQCIGWVVADNLLTQGSVNPQQLDILAIYGTTLGHLIRQREIKETLTTRSNSLDLLKQVADHLHQVHDPQTVFATTSQTLLDLLKARSVIIYELDATGQILRSIHSAGEFEEGLPIIPELPIQTSLNGYAIRNRSIVTSTDFERDQARNSSSARAPYPFSANYVVSIPIIEGENVWGSIAIGWAETLQFSLEDTATFSSIGKTVGMALANAHFVEALRQEKSLSDSIIESMPNLFLMCSQEGKLLQWNTNLEIISNRSAADLSMLTIYDLLNEADHAAWDDLVELTMEELPGSVYLSFKSYRNQFVPHIISMRKNPKNGTPRLIVTAVDLSDRLQLMEHVQHQALQLKTAGDVSKSFITILDIEQLMQYTVDIVRERFHYSYVGIFLVDAAQEYAVLQAGSGEVGRRMVESKYHLPLDEESMIGRCILRREPVISSEVEIEQSHKFNPYLPDTRSEMALPLINREACLGGITVQCTNIGAFTQDDIAIMQFIVDHLASALANARLYDIIHRRERYLGTLRRISQRSLPERDVHGFLQAFTQGIASEFEYAIAGIMLADHEKRVLYSGPFAFSGVEGPAEQFDAVFPFERGIVGWVVTNQKPYLCRETIGEPLYSPSEKIPRVRSVLAVPIWQHQLVIGVLVISSLIPDSLDELDLEMMTELAAELALQMENRKLYAEAEENALELEQRVIERTSQLRIVNKELETFAYSVSHDLRAPLRIINGFTQALAEDYEAVLDTGAKEYLERIQTASTRMGQLIDDLLLLSRVARREFHKREVNLSEIAASVMETLILQETQREVKLIIADEMIAMGDARLLRILFENLLGNAWKFTRNRPQTQIEVAFQIESGGAVVYYIRDNGVGFNMDYAEKLFYPFQRLHAPEEFDGTGIGLATVNRIIQRHGGRIWVEAAEGQGATFFFTLDEQPSAEELDTL